VYVDSNSYIYAATSWGGLSISTDGGVSFTSKTTTDGLGIRHITGVTGDSSGYIYAITFAGLSKSRNPK
jgi:hypothetical protein